MVNLINNTVFKGKLLIANATATTYPDVALYLNDAITGYQEDFLKKLMGPDFYLQFTQWYDIDPGDTDNAFYYLLNGKLFSYNGCSHQWVGLRKPLANYVYFYLQRENATQTTSPGEAKTNSKNAFRAGPYDKQKTAWDEMADWLCDYASFMDAFYGTYEGLVPEPSLLPYHPPVQTEADVTVGVISGTNTFTFDGTAGTPDWRGYAIYPERIGQGTLVESAYSWVPHTGVFTLLGMGDIFQPNEVFNFTFGLGGLTFTEITSGYWSGYKRYFYKQGFTKNINPF